MKENLEVRAFEMPIQSIEPKEGWGLLRRCHKEVTMFSNWCANMLYKHDVVRLPGVDECPKMKPLDLYALAFGRKEEKRGRKDENKILPVVEAQYSDGGFFEGAAVTASSIIQRVQRMYIKDRPAVWCNRRARRQYDAPQPWIIHANQWDEMAEPHGGWASLGFAEGLLSSEGRLLPFCLAREEKKKNGKVKQYLKPAFLDGSGRPCIVVSLPGGKVLVRLRGGPEFGRQMAQFKRVVAGAAPRLEMQIFPKPRTNSFHRRGKGEDREMVKMVVKFPPPEKKEGRPLVLLTDQQAFWVAELDGRRAWALNNDHYKRGAARQRDHLKRLEQHEKHLDRLDRMAQDAKAERRIGNNRADRQQARLNCICEKDAKRMDSWVKESVSHLVRFCLRQGVGTVLYLDRDKGFIKSFPWFKLHQQLKQKCAFPGEGVPSIAFHSESGLEKEEKEGSPCGADGGPSGDVVPPAGKEEEKWLRIDRLMEAAGLKVLAARRRSGSHPVVIVP